MTDDQVLVFGLLLCTVALFVSDRLRMDVVALLVILALVLTGLLAPAEALAGFGDPLVILIAALFIVGEGLLRTGVAFSAGSWLLRVAGDSNRRLLVLLMLVVALLSAFMSNTGAVAIFIPVTLSLASRAGLPPSRLLLPVAYAGSIGGMLTLIGTPPNLVVSAELSRAGLEAFGFFSFLPIGLLIFAATVTLIVVLGPLLLPDREQSRSGEQRMSLADLVALYGIERRFHMVQVRDNSPLVGKTVGEALLRSRFGVTVIALERRERGRRSTLPVVLDTEYRSGDLLFLTGSERESERLLKSVRGIARVPIERSASGGPVTEIGLAEVLLAPRSNLNGRTIREVRFREDHGLSVLGILRRGESLHDDLLDTRLEFGDSLLVGGGWPQIERLQRATEDFVVLTLPREMDEIAPHRERAPQALTIVAAMLLLMTLSDLAAVTVVLIAAVAMVLARCVSMEEAYRAVNWQSVVLIAGMLPMGTALDQTGGLDLVVDGLVAGLGPYGPQAIMVGIFLLTSIFSQFISNTATAVLIAPVAVGAAASLGVSPYPLLMTVAIAASAAFSTPMASPANTLVIGPGGYRFTDFLRLGIPLQLLALAVAVVAVPVLFPL
ncbi:MAG: SLC13 family permease [Halieaceae bacterium]|jgi:di/tricarboxylate transporter|nr:SLC13 family permease [Halieaceae bacterium]